MVARRIIVVGLGPAGAELITWRTRSLLDGRNQVWLRTGRHPAAGEVRFDGTFDELYDEADRIDDVYEGIVDRLVELADEHGTVVYAVPGSPLVAERTVELLRARTDIEVEIEPAVSFVDLCWQALGIDPLTDSVTIVDAHRFAVDAAGRLGPLLVTQVHSQAVLEQVHLALGEDGPDEVTVMQRLGTGDASIRTIPWSGLLGSVDPDHMTTLWIPRLTAPIAASFARFEELVRTLRAECPWDREQTHGSLRKHLLEETYELLEAIDHVDARAPETYVELEEELGDLLFQIFFHSRLAAEAGQFGVADVADRIHDKLVERHPHVFGDADPGETVGNWELAKKKEKDRESVMDGIPTALPALLHALKVQKRAAATGFSGPDFDWAIEDVRTELGELVADPGEHELGDLLYAAVQVARMLDVDPETALRAASDRFADRFRIVERRAAAADIELASAPMRVLGDLWAVAKAEANGPD